MEGSRILQIRNTKYIKSYLDWKKNLHRVMDEYSKEENYFKEWLIRLKSRKCELA